MLNANNRRNDRLCVITFSWQLTNNMRFSSIQFVAKYNGFFEQIGPSNGIIHITILPHNLKLIKYLVICYFDCDNFFPIKYKSHRQMVDTLFLFVHAVSVIYHVRMFVSSMKLDPLSVTSSFRFCFTFSCSVWFFIPSHSLTHILTSHKSISAARCFISHFVCSNLIHIHIAHTYTQKYLNISSLLKRISRSQSLTHGFIVKYRFLRKEKVNFLQLSFRLEAKDWIDAKNIQPVRIIICYNF